MSSRAIQQAQELALPLDQPLGTRSRPIRRGSVVRTGKGRSFQPDRFRDPKVSYSKKGERHVRFNKRDAYRGVDFNGEKVYVNVKVVDWTPDTEKKPIRRRRR